MSMTRYVGGPLQGTGESPKDVARRPLTDSGQLGHLLESWSLHVPSAVAGMLLHTGAVHGFHNLACSW